MNTGLAASLRQLFCGVHLLVMAAAATAGDMPVTGMEREAWILQGNQRELRWVNVKEHAPDGLLHIEVLSRAPAAKPWAFKRLAAHMAVTPEAQQASAVRRGSYGECYPEAYFWARKAWEDMAKAGNAPVCSTNLMDCLKQQR